MKLSLKEWRMARGLSREQLAKRLGVGKTTLYYWETNKRKMTIDKAYTAAAELGVTIDDIKFF